MDHETRYGAQRVGFLQKQIKMPDGLVGKNDLVKVLGDGDLKSPLTVHAHKFSKSAQEKIAKSGGQAEVIGVFVAAAIKNDKKKKKKS